MCVCVYACAIGAILQKKRSVHAPDIDPLFSKLRPLMRNGRIKDGFGSGALIAMGINKRLRASVDRIDGASDANRVQMHAEYHSVSFVRVHRNARSRFVRNLAGILPFLKRFGIARS